MRRPLAGLGFWPRRVRPRVGGVLRMLRRRRMIRRPRHGLYQPMCGWPGYRWGRGPDWTTTGVIRPVTEIQRSVAVAVDDFTGAAGRSGVCRCGPCRPGGTGCRLGVVAAVVDLAGGEPAIGHGQGAAMPGGLVGQLRPDQSHRGIGDGAPETPAAPCPVSSRPRRGPRSRCGRRCPPTRW